MHLARSYRAQADDDDNDDDNDDDVVRHGCRCSERVDGPTAKHWVCEQRHAKIPSVATSVQRQSNSNDIARTISEMVGAIDAA